VIGFGKKEFLKLKIGSLKMMVGWQGVQMGKPRPPLEQPTKEKEEKLKNDLRAAGYPYLLSPSLFLSLLFFDCVYAPYCLNALWQRS
jgi:hypothetical protein